MSFSDSQLTAILSAQHILGNVGLSPCDLDFPSPPPATTPSYTPLLPSPKVNRQTYVQALVEHSLGAIVKYPEMGASKDLSVAHIFDVNPDPDHFINPKFNFQYSLGDGHGGQNNALCDLLKGAAGNPVLCEKLRTSCKGLKLCSLHISHNILPHHFANRHELTHINSSPIHTSEDTAEREVFLKTISFFCALKDKGCALTSEDLPDGILDSGSADLSEYEDDTEVVGKFNHIAHASHRP
ncbi:hypothetical protein EV424DRAFT_1550855 [Suillus variegatus]|nr:hypothetical protein EV424DRAFT_1550855 [Suillus variegatus]